MHQVVVLFFIALSANPLAKTICAALELALHTADLKIDPVTFLASAIPLFTNDYPRLDTFLAVENLLHAIGGVAVFRFESRCFGIVLETGTVAGIWISVDVLTAAKADNDLGE